jgi:cytoskeletal protein CcmA (bactofilin family)
MQAKTTHMIGDKRMTLFNRSKQAAAPTALSTATLPTAPKTPTFDTVLGAQSDVDGSLRCKGNIRLDGSFSGALEIDGNVLVGETALISADINANHISVAGTVRGNVSGNKVQILRTGRIEGNISARSLAMDDGAYIDGKITMITPPAEPNKPTPSEKAPEENLELPADLAEALEMPPAETEQPQAQETNDD